jgi:hypothetical protein
LLTWCNASLSGNHRQKATNLRSDGLTRLSVNPTIAQSNDDLNVGDWGQRRNEKIFFATSRVYVG